MKELTGRVIGAAIEVHRHLGPSMLESAYETCLVYKLHAQGIAFERQVPLPLDYRGHRLDCGSIMDLVVERQLIMN